MSAAQKVKYLDHMLLDKINYISQKTLKYNRTLPQELIDQLPTDKFFIVTPLLVHEHRAGKACDPHMRCRIYAGPEAEARFGYLILDIEMGMYELIPVFEHNPEPAPANDSNTPAIVS